MAPLTLAELSKAQAEAEGFQQGPQPTLNQANLYVQDCLNNNSQTPGTPASTIPYYPSAETPNLNLSTDDMSSTIANNFVILDTLVGGPTPAVPTVTASVQAVNTSVPQNVSITAPAGVGTMYAISLYLAAIGTGSPGSTYATNISYIAANGAGTQVITLILPLDSANVVMETYPILVLGGSTVTSVGTFTGPASAYTISERIVSMPTN